MEKFISDENIHDGHRCRMKAKLLSHGRSIFDTYELLEMLLYYVIPYKDTKKKKAFLFLSPPGNGPSCKRLLSRQVRKWQTIPGFYTPCSSS